MEVPDISTFMEAVFDRTQDQEAAAHDAYQQLENAGLINRVVVHRYVCRKCGPVATVVRVGETTILRTRDYQTSPGLNEATSVPEARERNTLDGAGHWPGHTFNLNELAKWGPEAGMDANCRHGRRTLRAVDVLDLTRDTRPGHPSKPTVF